MEDTNEIEDTIPLIEYDNPHTDEHFAPTQSYLPRRITCLHHPTSFPDKVAFFGHVVFKQLQVHSFYMIYALYTSYKHWPVVFDRFASCLDHFPAYFALFLPRMRSPQTSEKKVFFGHEKKPFDLQQKMSRSN